MLVKGIKDVHEATRPKYDAPIEVFPLCVLSERASTIFKYNNVIHWVRNSINAWIVPTNGKQWVVELTYCATVAVILHSTASHVATIIPIWPMRCISIVMWEISGNSHKAVAVVAMKRKASVNVKERKSGPGRTELNQGSMATGLAQVEDISTPTPIYTLSTPVLAQSLLPNTIMPAHRHASTARSGGPYKTSIIVISSDEEDEPLSVPKRGSRKPRRSRVEGEILEILDETPVKVEEPELESLRRRCHELEQACSPHYSMNPPYKRNSSGPNLLGARYVGE